MGEGSGVQMCGETERMGWGGGGGLCGLKVLVGMCVRECRLGRWMGWWYLVEQLPKERGDRLRM